VLIDSYRRMRATPHCASQLAFVLGLATAITACSTNATRDTAAVTTSPAKHYACDNSLKEVFSSDSDTHILLVKAFAKGDPLTLSGKIDAGTPVASNDLCVVKISVGPGHSGPPTAPSTSPGIGIEVWLPSPDKWNHRLHVRGGSGWAGGIHQLPDGLAGAVLNNRGEQVPEPFRIAGEEGAVSATTDTGHSVGDGSFAMNPNGTINNALWNDFSMRGIHEMAVKAKALALAYYGSPPKYSYWDGFSTGGRQGLKEAQANPGDFDGILDGAPAINWTTFITGMLYPQVIMQRDLHGRLLNQGQLSTVSNAAIAACDIVGGQHLGYIEDPSQCRYDPTRDAAVICKSAGGESESPSCVNRVQAEVFNKIWYGQTVDGSAPSPASDNGFAKDPAEKQIWYGPTRGTDLSLLAGKSPFPIASDLVALELQDPQVATPSFKNALSNGTDGWKYLSYAQLANAAFKGLRYQPLFGNINTDDPDLTTFKTHGGKILMYHGLADTLIMPQGSVNYFDRVARQMGGVEEVQTFLRLFLIPGMSHWFYNGTSNPVAMPPLPTHAQLYAALVGWVEQDAAPSRIDIRETDTTPPKSRPICAYPEKATYRTGDPLQAQSYECM
jgi:hypothetical protein